MVAVLVELGLARYSTVCNQFVASRVGIADMGLTVALVHMAESPVVAAVVIVGTTVVGFPCRCWLVA